jgi:transketolase
MRLTYTVLQSALSFQITIDGETDLSFTENVLKRYDAYGWHTSTVADGNNQKDLLAKIEAARKVQGETPFVCSHTV